MFHQSEENQAWGYSEVSFLLKMFAFDPMPLLIFRFSLIVRVGDGKKWKPSDSSGSDSESVSWFSLHLKALMTSIPTAIPTPTKVKTRLK